MSPLTFHACPTPTPPAPLPSCSFRARQLLYSYKVQSPFHQGACGGCCQYLHIHSIKSLAGSPKRHYTWGRKSECVRCQPPSPTCTSLLYPAGHCEPAFLFITVPCIKVMLTARWWRPTCTCSCPCHDSIICQQDAPVRIEKTKHACIVSMLEPDQAPACRHTEALVFTDKATHSACLLSTLSMLGAWSCEYGQRQHRCKVTTSAYQ